MKVPLFFLFRQLNGDGFWKGFDFPWIEMMPIAFLPRVSTGPMVIIATILSFRKTCAMEASLSLETPEISILPLF